MPRIIFIRPAETDYQTHHQVLGRDEVDLSEGGYRHAQQLAEALRTYNVTFLAASPVKRALATAMAISDYQEDISVIPAAGFQAIDMGEWEGQTQEIIEQTDRARWQSFLTDSDFRAPGGESKREVYARAYPALVDIVEHTGPEETIALVLQEAVMQVLCCVALDLDLESAHRFQMDNAAYAVFERLYPSGPYQMVAWNRNEHLKQTEEENEEALAAFYC